jgi:hypothetical protein
VTAVQLYTALLEIDTELPSAVLTVLGNCKDSDCECRRRSQDIEGFLSVMNSHKCRSERSLKGSINSVVNHPITKLVQNGDFELKD